MNRPTLSTLRRSRFPAVLGINSEDISTVAAVANEVVERLIMDPLAPDEGWFGGSAQMLFVPQVTNFGATIIAPREVARIIVQDICNKPRMLRNRFYEYLQFGKGLQPPPCQVCPSGLPQAYERDLSPTLNPFPTSVPQAIRLYPGSPVDVGTQVIVQGTDQNGMTVYSTDPTTGEAILGEIVYLQSPFAEATHTYQSITGLIKQPTLGQLQVFTVDDTGTQTELSTMEPSETVAGYRVYYVGNLPSNCCNTPTGQVTVTAQCKLDFVPCQSDSDYLYIWSLPAMIEEAQALRYNRMDSARAAQLEAKHHAKAISLLCGQMDHYYGKVQTAVSLRIFGGNRLRCQPV